MQLKQKIATLDDKIEATTNDELKVVYAQQQLELEKQITELEKQITQQGHFKI